MYALFCHHCGHSHLMGARSILSLHNTSEGVIAYVRCPEGHELFTTFDGRRPSMPTEPPRELVESGAGTTA
jgi:hypothetical protein